MMRTKHPVDHIAGTPTGGKHVDQPSGNDRVGDGALRHLPRVTSSQAPRAVGAPARHGVFRATIALRLFVYDWQSDLEHRQGVVRNVRQHVIASFNGGSIKFASFRGPSFVLLP